jgi:hypothetical protein
MTTPAPPPTRILSWQQMVEENDPDYYKRLLRAITYEFSNGRRFVGVPNVYTASEP